MPGDPLFAIDSSGAAKKSRKRHADSEVDRPAQKRQRLEKPAKRKEESEPEPEHFDDASDRSDAFDEMEDAPAKPLSKNQRRNAPIEQSAKIKVPYMRINLHQKQYRPRDPRFESLVDDGMSETSVKAMMKKNYEFLEEWKSDEQKELSRALKKVKSETKREQLHKQLQESRQQQVQQKRDDEQQRLLSQWKKQEMAQRSQGKSPFYLKKCLWKWCVLSAIDLTF